MFIGIVMVGVHVASHQNSKTVTRFLAGLLSLEKGVWVAQFEMAGPKIAKEKFVFGMIKQKSSIQIFYFLFLHFCARETACGPKKTLFLGRPVYVGFLRS